MTEYYTSRQERLPNTRRSGVRLKKTKTALLEIRLVG
jgi:hypothetical protein